MVAVNGYTATHMDEQIALVKLRNVIFSRKTANYTLVLTDPGKVIEMNLAGANNLTVPPNVDVAIPVGSVICGTQYGAGLTTIVAGSGVTINSLGGALNSAGQYSRFTLEKVGTNEWYLYGDIAV